jgi:cytochrome c-type biogenesis protein CcmH
MNKQLRSPLFSLVLLLLLAGALFMAVRSVSAQGSTPTDDQVNAIARQLYCPVCENTPLDVCPTEACRQWRELIRKQLGEGWSEDQIKQYFVDNYGARVLSEPPRTGLNWIVYILPPVLIVAGAFVLFRAMRSWTRPSATEPPVEDMQQSKPVEDEYIARLEEEVRKRK